MTTWSKFEDIDVWQKAREVAKDKYLLTSKEIFKNDYSLRNQMRKTAGSIMDNIAEGFDRGGNQEFIQFLSISRGSAGELKSQIYRAFDYKFISEKEFSDYIENVEAISKMISGLINYLNKKTYRGIKYKSR